MAPALSLGSRLPPRQFGTCRSLRLSVSRQRCVTPFRNRTCRLRTVPVAMSLLKVTEQSTGVEFPLVQQFWEGDEFRCLGAAARLKRVLFVNVKVYAIALYVEASKAAKELKIRDRGDFFEDADSGTFCDAIMDGAFNKVLQIALVRDVTGDQFLEAIEEAIGAKLKFIGASDVFEEFKSFINEQALTKGSTVLLHWSVGGYLDACIVPEDVTDMSSATAGMKRFENVGFCRSMFELYMGGDAIIPAAKESWAEGAKLLLESVRN